MPFLCPHGIPNTLLLWQLSRWIIVNYRSIFSILLKEKDKPLIICISWIQGWIDKKRNIKKRNKWRDSFIVVSIFTDDGLRTVSEANLQYTLSREAEEATPSGPPWFEPADPSGLQIHYLIEYCYSFYSVLLLEIKEFKNFKLFFD